MKIAVEGMTCGHCERAIQQAVARLGGTARVNLAAGTVEVDGVADVASVRAAIEDEGYRVGDVSTSPASAAHTPRLD